MKLAVIAPLVFVACSDAPAIPIIDDGGEEAGDAAVVRDAATPKDAAPAPKDAAPDVSAPDPNSIPWQTGANVGYGVASKDTQNPLGNSMMIAYAGYDVSLASAEAWATALYEAALEKRGVRHIWAVQGPADPSYSQQEIGNSKIAAAMIPMVDQGTQLVFVAGHSSGSFVAHELLDQLASGADPDGVTKDLVTYFDLDGGGGFTQAAIDRVKKAFFVGSHDGATLSPNHADMSYLGNLYASKGGFYDNDASASGCNAGAEWCVHVTLITTKPHDPTNADPLHDYSDFTGRPVCTSYITLLP